MTGGDPLARLLPAGQSVVRGWRRPIGQNREGLPARLTDSAANPDAFVPVIVALTESPSVADDRVVAANGTSPRQEVQRDHPGSMLSFASGSAIKRITAGVKGPPLTVLCQSFDLPAGLSPSGKVSFGTKKEYSFALLAARPPLRTLAGLKRLSV